MTRRSNSSGAFNEANTPIIALTEWPTKTTSVRPSSRTISTTSSAYPASSEYLLGIVCRQVRAAGPDVIEQDDPEIVLERGRNKPPHILIAPKAVREHHRTRTFPVIWTLLRSRTVTCDSILLPLSMQDGAETLRSAGRSRSTGTER